jgi:hypothetical protein
MLAPSRFGASSRNTVLDRPGSFGPAAQGRRTLAPGQRVRHLSCTTSTGYSALAFPALGPGRRFASFRANDFLHTGSYFEATVIRFASGPQICSPLRSSPSCDLMFTQQLWLFHPNNSRFVTSPSPGYASRPNRAIDDRGLSPHKIRSLVGCSPNAPRISRRPQNRCRQILMPIRLSLNPKPLHHR